MSVRLLSRTLLPPLPTTQTFFTDDFTTLKPAWTKATSYPTTGTVSVVSGKMRLSTNSTSPWAPASSVFLGNPSKPQGDSSIGAPAGVSDLDKTFDYTLSTITAEHYPTVLIRGRNAEMWPDGNGGNLFKTGYQLVFGIAPGGQNPFIELHQGFNAGQVAPIFHQDFTFPSVACRMHIIVVDSMLYLRIWAASTTEAAAFPTGGWTVSGPYVSDQSDGSIGFGIANGPDSAIKYVDIDNLSSTTNVLSIAGGTRAPTTADSGFVPYFVENYDTPAAAGSSSGQFAAVYANGWTNYQASGTMSPLTQISAHDGVMDIAMDGAHAAAGWWGPPATSANRKGGRFSMRAKAIGAFNNGPAVMIWPSSNVWAEGEIDFPESVSGPGGLIGFQDAPWIHHHKMTQGQEAQAQDIPLLVSWRDWHVYTCDWFPPGSTKGGSTGLVIYYVDGVEVYRTTTDVPSTDHRYTVQVGDYGTVGNMFIDWVRIDALA